MEINELLKSLERLAMPDDLHKKECKKAGVPLYYDYELLRSFITNSQKKPLLKELHICQDFIIVNIPDNEEEFCSIKFRGDSRARMMPDSESTWVVGIIDRHLAIALKTVLDGEQNKV